jgi:hypothetical protein
MNRTHAENEIAAHIEGNTMAAGLHAALADQEAELDRMRYLLHEAVGALRYISVKQREHLESYAGLVSERTVLIKHAELLADSADTWLEDNAVEADNLTGA